MESDNPIEHQDSIVSQPEKISAEDSSKATVLVKLMEVADQQNKNIENVSNSLNNVVVALKDRPTKKQARNWTTIICIILLCLVLLLYGPLIWIAKDNHHNSNILVDCTQKTGKCYKASLNDAKNKVNDLKQSYKDNRCEVEKFQISFAKLNNLKAPPLDADCS